MTKEQFNERFEALLEDGYIEKFIREKKDLVRLIWKVCRTTIHWQKMSFPCAWKGWHANTPLSVADGECSRKARKGSETSGASSNVRHLHIIHADAAMSN